MKLALIMQALSLVGLAIATGINIFRIEELERRLQQLKQQSQILQK